MYYINKNKETVEVSDKFIYCEELYLMYPTRIILYRVKYYSSNSPIKKSSARVYSNEYKCYIQRFWNLEAAPEEYLWEKRFEVKK